MTLYEVQGGYHELFVGPERDLVMQRLTTWVLHQAELAAGCATGPV